MGHGCHRCGSPNSCECPGESINEFCKDLPKKRRSHQSKGLVLWMPRTGLAMVPYEQNSGGWYCVVVAGTDSVYPVGGYNLFVPDIEIETAEPGIVARVAGVIKTSEGVTLATSFIPNACPKCGTTVDCRHTAEGSK